MTAYQIGGAFGAFFPTLIITFILYGLTATWPPSFRKTIVVNLLSATLSVAFGIIGASISAQELTFRLVPYYLGAQLIIMVADVYRSRRAESRERQKNAVRIEPRF